MSVLVFTISYNIFTLEQNASYYFLTNKTWLHWLTTLSKQVTYSFVNIRNKYFLVKFYLIAVSWILFVHYANYQSSKVIVIHFLFQLTGQHLFLFSSRQRSILAYISPFNFSLPERYSSNKLAARFGTPSNNQIHAQWSASLAR